MQNLLARALVSAFMFFGCQAGQQAVAQAQTPAEEGAWVPLFNGTTLEGWGRENGSATFQVEDGAIVGRTAAGSPNSFLVTQATYRDFELEFEVFDTDLNSGVQIRSNVRPGNGRVNGPQVEIEPSGEDGAEAGYVYGEAAGGWRTPEERLIPHKNYKDDDWNQYRIVAEGPRIQTFINGEAIEDLTDEELFETHPSGFIGLQVHRASGDREVRWRNLRIRRLHTWTDLFDGETLEGWAQRNGTATFRVEDGAIVGRTGINSPNSFLVTQQTFRNLILEFDVMADAGLNSGMQIRSRGREETAGDSGNQRAGRVTGPQVEIESSGEDGAEAGYIYGEGGAGGWRTPKERLIPHKKFNDGEWNSYRIIAQGPRIQTFINDEPVEDLTDEELYADFPEGFIGFQVHGVGERGPFEVRLRNVRVRELD